MESDDKMQLFFNGDATFSTATHLPHLKKIASKWSLAGDAQLLSFMQSFSDRIVSRSQDIKSQINELLYNSKMMEVKLNNSFNDFNAQANNQFVENRVYDEDPCVVQQPIEEKPEESHVQYAEAEMMTKMNEALQLCKRAITSHTDASKKSHYEARALPPLLNARLNASLPGDQSNKKEGERVAQIPKEAPTTVEGDADVVSLTSGDARHRVGDSSLESSLKTDASNGMKQGGKDLFADNNDDDNSDGELFSKPIPAKNRKFADDLEEVLKDKSNGRLGPASSSSSLASGKVGKGKVKSLFDDSESGEEEDILTQISNIVNKRPSADQSKSADSEKKGRASSKEIPVSAKSAFSPPEVKSRGPLPNESEDRPKPREIRQPPVAKKPFSLFDDDGDDDDDEEEDLFKTGAESKVKDSTAAGRKKGSIFDARVEPDRQPVHGIQKPVPVKSIFDDEDDDDDDIFSKLSKKTSDVTSKQEESKTKGSMFAETARVKNQDVSAAKTDKLNKVRSLFDDDDDDNDDAYIINYKSKAPDTHKEVVAIEKQPPPRQASPKKKKVKSLFDDDEDEEEEEEDGGDFFESLLKSAKISIPTTTIPTIASGKAADGTSGPDSTPTSDRLGFHQRRSLDVEIPSGNSVEPAPPPGKSKKSIFDDDDDDDEDEDGDLFSNLLIKKSEPSKKAESSPHPPPSTIVISSSAGIEPQIPAMTRADFPDSTPVLSSPKRAGKLEEVTSPRRPKAKGHIVSKLQTTLNIDPLALGPHSGRKSLSSREKEGKVEDETTEEFKDTDHDDNDGRVVAGEILPGKDGVGAEEPRAQTGGLDLGHTKMLTSLVKGRPRMPRRRPPTSRHPRGGEETVKEEAVSETNSNEGNNKVRDVPLAKTLDLFPPSAPPPPTADDWDLPQDEDDFFRSPREEPRGTFSPPPARDLPTRSEVERFFDVGGRERSEEFERGGFEPPPLLFGDGEDEDEDEDEVEDLFKETRKSEILKPSGEILQEKSLQVGSKSTGVPSKEPKVDPPKLKPVFAFDDDKEDGDDDDDDLFANLKPVGLGKQTMPRPSIVPSFPVQSKSIFGDDDDDDDLFADLGSPRKGSSTINRDQPPLLGEVSVKVSEEKSVPSDIPSSNPAKSLFDDDDEEEEEEDLFSEKVIPKTTQKNFKGPSKAVRKQENLFGDSDDDIFGFSSASARPQASSATSEVKHLASSSKTAKGRSSDLFNDPLSNL